MDDVRAIELLKTEFREGYNTGDIDRILSVFAGGFIDMSAGQPGFYGPEAHMQLRKRLTQLFSEFHVRMFMMVADISAAGDVATDWGWHKLWLTPKAGGPTRFVKLRYSEQWTKQNGEWRIFLLLTAPDPEPAMAPLNEVEVMRKMSVALPA